MNQKVKDFKKDLLSGNEITLTDEELLENLEEFLDAAIDAAKTVDAELDDLATETLDELLKMERDFKPFEEEPNTIDHVMDLRAKFFKPRPRGESDARVDELLAKAPEPSITEEQVRNKTWYEETPEDNDDNFWGNFFDGIDDEEDSTRSNRLHPNPPADRNGIADPIGIDGLPDATTPAVNAAASIGAADIDSPVDHRDSTYTIRCSTDFRPPLESTHIGSTSSTQPNNGVIPVGDIAAPADGSNPIDSISRADPLDDNTVTGPVHRTGIVDSDGIVDPIEDPVDRTGIADPIEIDGLPDATTPAVNAAASIGATDIDSPVDHRDSTYTIRCSTDFRPPLASTHIDPTSSAQPNDGAIPVGDIAAPADGTNPIDSIRRENPVDDNIVRDSPSGTDPVHRTGIVDPNGIVDPMEDDVPVDRIGIADPNSGAIPVGDIAASFARNRVRRSEILVLPPATSQYAETPVEVRQSRNIRVLPIPNVPDPPVVEAAIERVSSVQASDVEDPDVHILSVQIPDAHDPGVHVASAQAPDVEDPDVHIPSVQIPDAHDPGVHVASAQAPDVEDPDVHILSVQIPDAHDPGVHVASAQAPDVEDPDVHILSVQIPDAHDPGVHVASAQAPDVEDPDVHIPSVQIPDAHDPGVQVASAQAPDVDDPDVSLPARQRTGERNPVERGVDAQRSDEQVPVVPDPDLPTPEIFQFDGIRDPNAANGINANADETSADQNEEFDMTREVHRLLRDVINGVPASQLLVRSTVVRSSQAFMVFCNLWCLGVFAVHFDQDQGTYLITIA